MNKPIYNLGDNVFWVRSSTHYGKEIQCPMCFGQKQVTIILGDDSRVESVCGYCAHGIYKASGVSKTWEPMAVVCSGEVTGVSLSRDDCWQYQVAHASLDENEIFTDLAVAEEERVIRLKVVTEQADIYFKESFVTATRKQIWDAGYHRECIKREERTIEWHRARLCLIKDSTKPSEGNEP